MTHAVTLDQIPGRLPTCGPRCRVVRFVSPETGHLARTWLHDPDDHDGVCGACAQQRHAVIRVHDLEIDAQRTEVRRDGQPLPLTPTEWRLLAYLAQHPGQTMKHREILDAVWGQGWDDLHLLNVHFARLRAKLGAGAHQIVRTIVGIGYRFEDGTPLALVSVAPPPPRPLKPRPKADPRTHCVRGLHAWTEANIVADGANRRCRQCRERSRRERVGMPR